MPLRVSAFVVGLVGLLVAALGCTPRPPVTPPFEPHVVRRISMEETDRRIAAGETAIWVDTRDRVVGPRIAGAEHVPYAWLGTWAKEQPKDAFIVAYCRCRHEAAAARHVLDLQGAGFTNAYALLGGLAAWTAAGRPTEVLP